MELKHVDDLKHKGLYYLQCSINNFYYFFKEEKMKKRLLVFLSILAVLSTSVGCGSSSSDSRTFRIVLRILEGASFTASTGASIPVVLAPGAAAVHFPEAEPFFTIGAAASPGLEVMSEDGGGTLLAAEADVVSGVRETVAFGIPVGADGPGPLTPGNSYEFTVNAQPGEHLSFATMFVQSNDLFIAPNPEGIALFDENGLPRTGNLVAEAPLWDAGTEVDEEPGIGENQAPRQAEANTGAEEGGVVRLIADGRFPTIPELSTIVEVSVELAS